MVIDLPILLIDERFPMNLKSLYLLPALLLAHSAALAAPKISDDPFKNVV